ncbi:DUF6434 domain-containing protein [Enterococcus alishanensis]
MSERPLLEQSLSPEEFQDYYFLKEELVAFLRNHQLPTSGSKELLNQRIVAFLTDGTILKTASKNKNQQQITEISLESLIEENIICSEVHRKFFKETIGPNFTFKVAFQNWLKANAGKTYASAIEAYQEIIHQKPIRKKIDGQFEYNTYIRDFFENQKDKTLTEAIICWKYKKSLPGHNRYETSDLNSLI